MPFFSFLLGTCVGSFLNVLVDRIPRNEDFFLTPSHCESCKKKLSWLDLIPLVSFFILSGKCRYCHARLSYYYPIIELFTGGVFVFVLLSAKITNPFGFAQGGYELRITEWIPLVYQLLVFSGLIVIFFTDLKYRIIPDKIVLFLIVVVSLVLLAPQNAGIHVLSALGAGFFFFLLFYFTRGQGMGFGDVKLAFFMGLFLGFPNIIVSLYVAFLTGAIVSLILILARKKKFRGGTIAFGPFLVFGTFIAFFTGHEITAYILRTF